MESLVMTVSLAAGLAFFVAAAVLWGADSRDWLTDDHQRPSR